MRISWRVHQAFTEQGHIQCMEKSTEAELPKLSSNNFAAGVGLVLVGVAVAAAGIYVGDTDDAPGAALLGIVLMIGAVAFGVRIALRRK
jgi:hypothetical protein